MGQYFLDTQKAPNLHYSPLAVGIIKKNISYVSFELPWSAAIKIFTEHCCAAEHHLLSSN